jgi:predicted SAM-dependent methyltransferase
MRKIQFCCGTHHLEGWDNHDRDVDITRRLPFPDAIADFILVEHGLEHVEPAHGYDFLRECHRVLKTGGVLRVCVPAIEKIARCSREYAEFVRSRSRLNASAVEIAVKCWGHKSVYTLETLGILMQDIGFSVEPANPNRSRHPELCGIDGHSKRVGSDINREETGILEGTKTAGQGEQAKSSVYFWAELPASNGPPSSAFSSGGVRIIGAGAADSGSAHRSSLRFSK